MTDGIHISDKLSLFFSGLLQQAMASLLSPLCLTEIFNCILLLLLTLGEVLSAKIANLLPVFHRGFFCDDQSIRYPFHQSTVPYWSLGIAYPCFLVLFMMPLVVIQSRANRKNAQLVDKSNSLCVTNSRDDLRIRVEPEEFMWKLYHSVTNFLFGLSVNGIVTNVLKHAVGRLRPNFVSVCQPAACENLSNSSVFVIEAECGSGDVDAIADSRRSFPSGHTSCAFYLAVFSALYLQQTLSSSCLSKCFLLPLSQLSLLLMASLVAVTRLGDNKHHPTDVLAGAVLGTVVALWSAVYLSRLRDSWKWRSTSCRSSAARQRLSNSNGVEKFSMQSIVAEETS